MSLRRALSPALWALRAYWGTALLLAAAAALALAALLPVTSLAGRLGLVPWQGGDLGMSWSALAGTPTSTQRAAVDLLFRLLLGVALGAGAVAGLTVISLSAARASARAPDLALRRAVGASRRHLVAAGLIEAAAIAAVALLVGVSLGTAAGRLAAAAWPGTLGRAALAPSVVGAVVTVAGLALGGLLPFLLPRRASALPGPTGKPLELTVPALQLGLSLTVLTAATLLQREAGRFIGSGGESTAAGQAFEVTAPESPPAARAAAYASLLRQLGLRPRVKAVSLASRGTLVGLGVVDIVTTDCGNCFQGGLAYPLHPVPATHYLVSADTFGVLGLSVIAGRGISAADRWGTDHVAVVSYSLAARHFQEGAAVGRRILVGGAGAQADWYRVVGIVQDQRPAGFGAGLQPPNAVYLSVLQHPARSVELLIRAPADVRDRTGAAVKHRLHDTLGVGRAEVVARSESEVVAAAAAPFWWFARMLAAEGWVTLALAVLGTFVVMQLWVASLRHEIGVRRAVGARRRAVLGFILSRAAGVAVGGVAIGLWAGLFVWGTLGIVASGLPAWDAGAALRLSPLLVGAALAGALLPGWRAVRAQPATSLTP